MDPIHPRHACSSFTGAFAWRASGHLYLADSPPRLVLGGEYRPHVLLIRWWLSNISVASRIKDTSPRPHLPDQINISLIRNIRLGQNQRIPSMRLYFSRWPFHRMSIISIAHRICIPPAGGVNTDISSTKAVAGILPQHGQVRARH